MTVLPDHGDTALPTATATHAAPRPGVRLHIASWLILLAAGSLCLALAWAGHPASALPFELRAAFSLLGAAGLIAAGSVVFCLWYLHALPEFLRLSWKARHGSLAGYREHRTSKDAAALLRARTPAGRRIIGLREGIW